MLNDEKQRQITILIITGIVIVSIITILILISIWTPAKEEPISDEFRVGYIDYEQYTDEDIVKNYYTKIMVNFLNSDYEKIYNNLSKDYIEYSNMTLTKLKDKLENMQIVGKVLQLNSFQKSYLNDYTIYYVNLQAQGDASDITIVIREYSPENYSISFDDFIYMDENIYNKTYESLNLNVNRVIYTVDKVKYNITLTNKFSGNIVINSKKLYEGIYLKDLSDNIKSPYSVTFGGSEIKLIENQKKDFEVIYDIEDMSYSYIKGLVVRDVFYNSINKTTDVTYNF